MFILGLTGSIAMGKSTAAGMFRRLGIPVYDADAAVHALLARRGQGVEPVERAFPGVVHDGAVDRKKLAARVFGNPSALQELEGILHPLVHEERRKFLGVAARRKQAIVVLDIPLLFETGIDGMCDAVAVVTAPAFLQMQRLQRRPGMDAFRIQSVLARQMPDREKRRRADFVIQSGQGRAPTLRAIRRCLSQVRQRTPLAWPRHNRPAKIRRSTTRCR